MKKLLLILALSAFSFAQTPAPSGDAKKDEGGCCGSMKCCENMKKEKDGKSGCCAGEAKEGAMCARKPMKDDKKPAETPKSEKPKS